jgi:hypothetical protein
MPEQLSLPGYYTTRQAAKKLGVSEGRIRKLANIYGWVSCTQGTTQFYSAADIGKYIEVRLYFNRINHS